MAKSKRADVKPCIVHDERTIYDNKWVRLTEVDLAPPSGPRFWHHVVRLNTVSIAAVINSKSEVLMMWRHRFVPDKFGWELPGGIVEKAEDGLVTAARETAEETGWQPINGQHLITFEPCPGMVETPHEIYLFRNAEYLGNPTEDDEEEDCYIEWINLDEAQNLIASGEISGCGTLVGLLYILASRAKLGF